MRAEQMIPIIFWAGLGFFFKPPAHSEVCALVQGGGAFVSIVAHPPTNLSLTP